MTYEADSSLEYNKTSETAGEAGTKSVTKVYKVNPTSGLTTELDGTPTETTTKAAKNKVIKVGNKQVTTETIEPGTTYEADSSLDYNNTSETAGEAGTKSVTKVYKVNKDTGLTTELDGTPTETTTKAAKNKVIKVGNVDTKTDVIKFTTTYIDDDTLDAGTERIITSGQDGSEKVVTTYKVDPTNGLTNQVEKTETIDHKDPVTQVVHKGTKTPQPPTPPAPDPNDPNNPSGQGGQGDGGQGGDQGGHGNDSQGGHGDGGQGGEGGNTGDGGQGGQGSGTGNTGTGNTGSGAGDDTHGGLNPDNPYGGHFVEPAWTYNPELNIWEWNGNGTNDHSNDGNGSNSNGSNGANSAADSAGASAGTNGSANGSNANANGANGSGANGAGANGANSSNAKNHKLSATGANASSAAFASFGSMLLGLLGLFGAASKRRSSKHSNR